MFDIGWSEILLTIVVALIVIGPKDLPKALYEAGKWMRHLRQMAGEFHHNLNIVLHEAELDDLRRQAAAVRDFNLGHEIGKTLDPDGAARAALNPAGFMPDPMDPTAIGTTPPAPVPPPAGDTPPRPRGRLEALAMDEPLAMGEPRLEAPQAEPPLPAPEPTPLPQIAEAPEAAAPAGLAAIDTATNRD